MLVAHFLLKNFMMMINLYTWMGESSFNQSIN